MNCSAGSYQDMTDNSLKQKKVLHCVSSLMRSYMLGAAGGCCVDCPPKLWWGLSRVSSFTCVGWRCSSCWNSCLRCLGRSEAAPFRLPPAAADRCQTFLPTFCLAGPNLKTVLDAASLLSSMQQRTKPKLEIQNCLKSRQPLTLLNKAAS